MKKRILSLLLVICMVASLLPMAVSAEDAKVASMTFAKGYTLNADGDKASSDISLTVTEGGEAAYALTTAEGLVTKDSANASNYHIKFEYPAGGTPTLYLNGANIKNEANYGMRPGYGKGLFDLKVVVEADSQVESNYGCIYTKGGDLTISGPGKLSLTVTNLHSAIGVLKPNDIDQYDLYLKDANLDVKFSGVSGELVSVEKGNIYIENTTFKGTSGVGSAFNIKGDISVLNSTVDINTSWAGFTTAVGGITIEKSTINAIAGFRPIDAKKDVLIKDSTAFLEGDHFENAAINIWGNFVIDNSTVEMFALQMPLFTEGTIPTFVGYYRAVAGEDDDATARYNEEFYDSYQYMKVVPADTPEESTEETYEEETEESTEGTNQTPSNDTSDNTSNETTNQPVSTPTNAPSDTGSNSDTVLLIVAAVMVLGSAIAAVLIIVKRRKSAE